MDRKAYYILFTIVLLATVSHSRHFGLSARGVHVWRQCNTLAVAQNYYSESMQLLYPRVDHRKSTDGVTGMSFPFYEYLLACTYQLTGVHNINHRLLQYLFYLLGIIAMYLIGKMVFRSDLSAGVMAFFYAFSPEMYYHGINALPDVSAMAAILWSIYFYLKKSGTVYAMLLLTLAALIKLQFALFGIAYLLYALYKRNNDRVVATSLLGLFSGGIVANWYIHSIHLRYESNLQDYGLFLNPASSVKEGLRIIKQNVLMDIPEQIIGYGFVPLVLLGVILLVKRYSPKALLTLLLMALPFLLFHLQELKQMEWHAYYMMPYLLPFALLIGLAARGLSQSKWVHILWILLPLQTYHTLNKINPRYSAENAQLPSEFLDLSQLEALRAQLGGSHRSIVGPDPSGCIYFYYLGSKGWNAFGIGQLEEKDDIRAAIEKDKVDILAIKGLDQQRQDYYQSKFPIKTQIGDFVILKKASLQ